LHSRRNKEGGVNCVAWAMNERDKSNPLIVYSISARFYIYSIQKDKVVGALRGHGGVSLSTFVISCEL
jgi:hypothetical protein